MVNVIVPSPIAPGISRRGILAFRNSACAIGASTKKATKTLTPPYVTSAPTSTTASTARCVPSHSIMKCAIVSTEPLSSMSLPNSAPSRNSGKNWARKCAPLVMKVCVQWARIGSPAIAAARMAAAGARRRTLQPRYASQISSASASKVPARLIESDLFEQADKRGTHHPRDGASALSVPLRRILGRLLGRTLGRPRGRLALSQRDPGQDLVAVLLAVHGDDEHPLVEEPRPEP